MNILKLVAILSFLFAYSVNVLITKGYEVTACDGVALNLSDDEFLSRVEQENQIYLSLRLLCMLSDMI